MLTGLDQVQIAVPDLEAATAEMARLLGRRPSWLGELPGQGARETLFRLANTTVALVAADGDGALGHEIAERLERGPGLFGLGFASGDLEATHLALGQAGLQPGAPADGLARDVDSGAFRRFRSLALPAQATRGVRVTVTSYEGPDDLLAKASPLGEPQASVQALDHVVVRTTDAEAARGIYGEGLGIRLALDRSFPKWGARLLFFRIAGLTVEVASSLADDADPEAPDHLWGLSWRVADAASARDRMAQAGFAVSEVRPGRKTGTHVFSVHEEPLGVATLVLQPPA